MSTWLTYNCDEGAVPRRAAVIIIHEQEKGSVLFVHRSQRLAFMGGHHAFPGGGVSEYDSGRCVRHASDADTARLITTAVRETFEETGVLLAMGWVPSLQECEAGRREVIEAPKRFEEFLEEHGLHIDSSDFTPAGHWITPSFSPIRFDTHYYLYRCDRALPVSPMGADAEITAVAWLRPQEALRQRGAHEIKLSTPLVFVLQRLAAFSPEEAIGRLQHTPGFSDVTLDYIEPVPGIHIVPVKAHTLPPATHTNCVLIGKTELAIVDPGVTDGVERERFIAHLEAMTEVVCGCPAAILLTHTHPDHCAFAEGLSERYDIPVYAHAAAQGDFRNGRVIEDGTCLELAGERPWSIRCLHTPGHHPGHLSFFEETTRTLLCGDVAANPGTIMIDIDAGGDMADYLASLEILAALDPALTIPGHGAPLLHGDGPEMFKRTLAHRRMREAKIAAIIEKGAHTLSEVLEQAYDDTPVVLHPLALRQLRAHLKQMGRELKEG